MNALAARPGFPTRRQEAFRYADLTALAPLWPVAAEVIRVAAGAAGALTVVAEGANDFVRELAIELAAGARFDLRVLNLGAGYGRIGVSVTLAEGADFVLGAVQIGGAEQTLEVVTEVRHLGPNATSRQVVRSVMAGSAVGTYLGKVAVAADLL